MPWALRSISIRSRRARSTSCRPGSSSTTTSAPWRAALIRMRGPPSATASRACTGSACAPRRSGSTMFRSSRRGPRRIATRRPRRTGPWSTRACRRPSRTSRVCSRRVSPSSSASRCCRPSSRRRCPAQATCPCLSPRTKSSEATPSWLLATTTRSRSSSCATLGARVGVMRATSTCPMTTSATRTWSATFGPSSPWTARTSRRPPRRSEFAGVRTL
mmetsp:Transcript_83411/g.268885  ORF Transcript_83411/g.268885 Transcript_83411/m.268885 type:complete len:217 (-) Transcript_83411:263-913(-)